MYATVTKAERQAGRIPVCFQDQAVLAAASPPAEGEAEIDEGANDTEPDAGSEGTALVRVLEAGAAMLGDAPLGLAA